MKTSKYKKITTALSGSFYASFLPFRGRHFVFKKIVACVFSVGELTEQKAIESIRQQRLPVSRLEIIKNVNPISAASNMALELAADADFLLWVDADMILDKHCTEQLLKLAGSNVLYAVAPLRDPVFGKVGYIKLLNMDIVRGLEIKFRDVLGCDVDFCRQAKEKDPSLQIERYTITRRTLGIHHPTYTAQELFKKNQVEKKKRGNRIDRKVLLSMARKYYKTGNPVLLAGMLGEIFSNPDKSSGESSLHSGLDNWNKAAELLGDIPDDVTFGFHDIE
ncbi:MAG: hypothetical protein J7L53_02630 [Deltaproteobacteria bacterium]|nr:hypothetical protein [Deltaproteobacteria bacterium]